MAEEIDMSNLKQAETAHETVRSATAPHRPVRKLHGYFVAFAATFATIVLVGFLRRFFIPVLNGTYSKPAIVNIHASVFFAWTLMLVVQIGLAASGRLQLHRRVGAFAGWLIVPILMLGTIVAARDTVHDFGAGDGEEALAFFYGELADLAMFGALAGGAMLLRHKPDYHKRWIVMGSLGLVGAAIGRIPEVSAHGLAIFFGLILSVLGYDLASRRELHRATLIAATTLLSLNLTQDAIGHTRVWLRLAHGLLGV